ncbi:hypothetical protein IE81DRAFT_192854 [Ceraceosorus guamensis]|uniref:Uncharacterized protein n=1 Tax=Ceraceosorus guamensis TaxID=1522189 RepID=A0A316WDC3_9BASI|nr:hypothetical protein IE81DRAFT_192854 [Ceraceosorus guamensis]PWN45495.1 hypothetical protein IE81DRAFT_192854 [Ceraceosorus guamensis]
MVKSLKYQRKSDLVDMGTLLGLSNPSDLKRDDLEDEVRNALLSRRAELQNDEHWKPIYGAIDSGERRAARSSLGATSPDSDASDDSPARAKSPRKHSGGRANGTATPRKTSSSLAQDASSTFNSLTARTKRSFESLKDAFRTGANEARTEVIEAREHVDHAAHGVAHRVKLQQRALIRGAGNLWHKAGVYASDANNLTTIFLALEAITLILSILPTTYFEFGSRASVSNLVKSGGKTAHSTVPHYAITIPNAWALLTVGFWRPIVLWTLYTVAVPYILAHLITFSRRRDFSAQTFTLSRLFLILFLVRITPGLLPKPAPAVLGVAAGQTAAAANAAAGGKLLSAQGLIQQYTSYDWVSAAISPELQVLAASAAAAFANLEALHTRPRAG